jgi:hypothetical protein
MSRANRKTNSPPISRNVTGRVSIGGTPVLSEQDLKRLMISKILSGMLANPRKSKFDVNSMIAKAKEYAEQIINITQ